MSGRRAHSEGVTRRLDFSRRLRAAGVNVFRRASDCRGAPPYTAAVNAAPVLSEVARAIKGVGLEAVLIGNAAAALQGAPVTTVDLDFFYRRTPRNVAKLKRLARVLRAVVLRPYYPV